MAADKPNRVVGTGLTAPGAPCHLNQAAGAKLPVICGQDKHTATRNSDPAFQDRGCHQDSEGPIAKLLNFRHPVGICRVGRLNRVAGLTQRLGQRPKPFDSGDKQEALPALSANPQQGQNRV